MRVLVVGAGLGGLCLAHGLRRSGIDVRVLERAPGPDRQPASYGIHLNADGLAGLCSCLPAVNWQRLVEVAVPATDIVRFHDEQLSVLATRDRESSTPDPVTRRRAVRRNALHEVLLLGLADTIRWGSRFRTYTDLPDGGIRVTCADGSEHAADLLIGADGSNSVVRGQRLPGLRREELDILNLAGRLPLTAEVRRHLPTSLVDGAVNNIVPPGPGWMFISTWNARPGDEADEFAVWAWVAARAGYPPDIDTLTSAQKLDLVAQRIETWAPALRYLVAHTAPDTVATVPLRSMPPLPAWAPTNVTLIGDAIHNMTPMAGVGANTALHDAGTLRGALLGPGTLIDRVGRYETRMREYANPALALSTRNARTAAAVARLPRLAFRTLLRAAEALPPIKRTMFGPANRLGAE